ncbi:hypothetical protein K1719_030240 [Acacia pycnantha]|nr:hypothetical protein K1719_030240 [Acacia pycnantha]
MPSVTKSGVNPLNSACASNEIAIRYCLVLAMDPRILLIWMMEGGGSLRSKRLNEATVSSMLNAFKESNNTEGIRLDILETERVEISGKALEKMKKLRILMVDNASFLGGVLYLSDEIKLTDWTKYPSSTLPTNFHPKRLVSVKMNHSRIKHLRKGVKIFQDLKFLFFNCCQYL